MKIKYLYHGSPHKLTGDNLMPSKGEDSLDRPENNQLGVYATHVKEIAIAMAIVSSKGVIGAGLDDYKQNKSPGIIHIGKPKQKYVYLYTLSPNGFKRTPSTKEQWISKKPVKPIKIERLKISDYENLIRYSKKDEAKKWKEKYLNKKNKPIGRDVEIKTKRLKIKKETKKKSF
jgi:hypothetical protein